MSCRDALCIHAEVGTEEVRPQPVWTRGMRPRSITQAYEASTLMRCATSGRPLTNRGYDLVSTPSAAARHRPNDWMRKLGCGQQKGGLTLVERLDRCCTPVCAATRVVGVVAGFRKVISTADYNPPSKSRSCVSVPIIRPEVGTAIAGGELV